MWISNWLKIPSNYTCSLGYPIASAVFFQPELATNYTPVLSFYPSVIWLWYGLPVPCRGQGLEFTSIPFGLQMQPLPLILPWMGADILCPHSDWPCYTGCRAWLPYTLNIFRVWVRLLFFFKFILPLHCYFGLPLEPEDWGWVVYVLFTLSSIQISNPFRI